MSVATRFIDDQPARVAPAPVETLYQFDESPLLARQSRQESNARSYPRRIPLAFMSKTSKDGVSSIAWQALARWRWVTITRW